MRSDRGGASREITLVGAGLVGSLLSMYLARRGFRVRILERRPDMRKETVDRGRSINLALSTRGIHALREMKLEREVLDHAIPMPGRMIHSPEGKLAFQAYGVDSSQHLNSLSRAGLNQALMTAAENTGRVTIEFNQRLVGADLAHGLLRMRDERTGEERELVAARVIGTDGSASALRAEMMRAPGASCAQELLEYGYKELVIPAGPGGEHRIEKKALHIWPRGDFMLIALPNADGSFTCTLFLKAEGVAESFQAIREPREVQALFERRFPDALPLIPDLEEAFFANSTGSMVTVKCSPWHLGGRALLVGDSAHAIVPFYGQGLNAGFEDCLILDECLAGLAPDSADEAWEEAFARFFERRKPDADAIAEMAQAQFVEMRDKTGNPRFLLEKEIEKRLLKELPGEFVSRYSLVTFSREPYRLAYDVGVAGEAILSELSQGISKADEVDLGRARELVRERLSPILKRRNDGSRT